MPRNYFPPTRRSRQRRRTFWIVLGILAVLAVVFVVFPTGLSTGRHPNQTTDTTTTTVTVSHVARTYEAVLSQYQTALVAPNAAITGATDDIATQEGRAQNDAASYTSHESGAACSSDALNPGLYESCLTAEHQSAQSALGDENDATQAEKVDASRQVTGVQEIESAINAFAQQLAGITWPSTVSPAVATLTQALDGYSNAYAQTASDLTGGKPISTHSQTVTTAGAAVATQLADMATTLGIAPASSPPTS
ncbi:MAG TPA: hypothetical protein VK215_11695 [Acidimicrobiales bacterium]|nr:hypothetical protein [Acidimicrobiales bacterium]HLN43113.1 hypothetical protein [Acidimicrobiales bacterium]